MKGWNLDDIVYLSRKLDLPDAYIMSMFRFLDKLVSGGLVDKACAVSILCYQFPLSLYKAITKPPCRRLCKGVEWKIFLF